MKNLKKFYVPLFMSKIVLLLFHLYQSDKYIINNYFTSINTLSSIENQSSNTFIVASDLHYLSSTLKDNSANFINFTLKGDGKNLLYINEITDSFIKEVKLSKPKFLVLSGDLTLNGEKASHLELSKKLKEVESEGTSVYVIPGNHDINNPWARGFSDTSMYKVDTVSANEFKDIYKNFGYKEAISKDKSSLSYLASPTKGVYLLMIDSCDYDKNIPYGISEMSGHISKETLSWIKDCSKLVNEKNGKIIAVTHHNLLNHSDYVYDGYTLENSNETLSTYKEAGISLNLSGHIHYQDIKTYNSDDYILRDISSSALSVFPHKYSSYTLGDNSISFNTQRLNVEEIAKNSNSTDKNLLTFTSYSENFYRNFIINQNLRWLNKTDKFNEDEKELICDTIANIRIKYDYKLDNITWAQIINSSGFELLKSCNSIYINHYIQLALQGNESSNNNDSFPF